MCAALFGLMAVCSTTVFSAGVRQPRGDLAARPRSSRNAAPVEIEVQVPVGCDDDAVDARDVAEGAGELLRDRLAAPCAACGRAETRRSPPDRRAPDWAAPRRRRAGTSARPNWRSNRVGDGVVDVSLNAENHGWSTAIASIRLRARAVTARRTVMFDTITVRDPAAPRALRSRPACSRSRAGDGDRRRASSSSAVDLAHAHVLRAGPLIVSRRSASRRTTAG